VRVCTCLCVCECRPTSASFPPFSRSLAPQTLGRELSGRARQEADRVWRKIGHYSHHGDDDEDLGPARQGSWDDEPGCLAYSQPQVL